MKAFRVKLLDCELYPEDISVINLGVESLPLLQDNTENKGMED